MRLPASASHWQAGGSWPGLCAAPIGAWNHSFSVPRWSRRVSVAWLYHGPQPAYADTVHDVSILVVLAQVILYEVRYQRGDHPADSRLPLAAVASFGIAAVFFLLGRTSSPLCDPDSPVQLHGAWHLFVACLSLLTVAQGSRGQPNERP